MRISWGLVAGLGMFGLALDVFGGQQPPVAAPDAVQMQIAAVKQRIANGEHDLPVLQTEAAAAGSLLAADRAALLKLCAPDPQRCAEGKK